MFDQMKRLSDPNCDIEKEMKRTEAIVSVGKTLIDSAKVEVDFIRATNSAGTGFIPGANGKKQKQLADGTMTQLQKEIIQKLLLGYNIAGNPRYGFRLRSPEQHVCRKFSYKTFFKIKNLLRKKGPVFLINKSKVRQLHGKSFAKTEYKNISKKLPAAAAENFFRKNFLVIKNLLPCIHNIKISLSKYMPRILNLSGHAVYADAHKTMHAFILTMGPAGGKKRTSAAIVHTGQAKEEFIHN